MKTSTLRNHNQIKILSLTLVVYEMAIKNPNNSSMEIDFIDFDIIARFFGIKLQNMVYCNINMWYLCESNTLILSVFTSPFNGTSYSKCKPNWF